MHLNKDIFLYGDVTLKPGETKTVLGNTNEKDVSDWRGYAVLQKKKDGKTRFTCDFRHMGPETCEKYQHPLPLIQEILDNLRGAWYFTKIDFTDSYFHIPIKAKYRELFAFATRRGVYQWTRLPQG
jgi:hypothetical protein